jgi:hypothetical protein
MCGGICAPNMTRCTNGQRQTCDATGTSWQNTPSPTIQLLANPAFDSGNVVWVEDSDSTSQIITNQSALTTITAHTAPYLAWLGGYDDAFDDLYQTVTIPAGATSISLSFYYAVRTDEVGSGIYDTVEAYTFDPMVGASSYQVHATFNDDTAVPNWTRYTTSLPLTLAGKTIEVGFLATTDSVDTTSFFIDSVSLEVAACVP